MHKLNAIYLRNHAVVVVGGRSLGFPIHTKYSPLSLTDRFVFGTEFYSMWASLLSLSFMETVCAHDMLAA